MVQRYASESEEANPHSELNWSSYKERRVDALALRADERRFGEEQISIDPEMSEWGNLAEKTSVVVW